MRIVGTLVACLLVVPGGAAAAAEPAASPANVTVVMALPDATVQVSIDDREVAADAVVKDILGPFQLDPGSHEIAFTDGTGSLDVVSRMDVKAGTSHDVVLHMPAEEDGTPVVSSFNTSMAPIAAGKARVLLAHTATVAPADVRVDGQVVFTNIANGEYAEADVPAGAHSVALLPTGQGPPPILGPLDVTLARGDDDHGLRRRLADDAVDGRRRAHGGPPVRRQRGARHHRHRQRRARGGARRSRRSARRLPRRSTTPIAPDDGPCCGWSALPGLGLSCPSAVSWPARPRTTTRQESRVAMTRRGLGALPSASPRWSRWGARTSARSGAAAEEHASSRRRRASRPGADPRRRGSRTSGRRAGHPRSSSPRSPG